MVSKMDGADVAIENSDLSRELALLDEMHERATHLALGGPAAAAIGAVLLAGDLGGHLGLVFGWVGVLGGPLFFFFGLAWFRLLPAAREALTETPIDVRLEVKLLRGGYGFKRFTMARLWPAVPSDQWLANFSETMHWQAPRLLTVNRVPARVYGAPTRGTAVVVSCSQGVVIGRIRRSRFERGS
jgi:hypothetical protein